MKKKLIPILVSLGIMVSSYLPLRTHACSNQEIIPHQWILEKVVLENTSKNQVVMFGEEHHGAKDNNLVIQILPELRKQGFDYFALEMCKNPRGQSYFKRMMRSYALGELKRLDLNEEQICIEKKYAAGWFDTIDVARAEGMKIICYDSIEYESFNDREEKSFKNLKELIFDKDPNAKVLVYCGAAHLHEKAVYDSTTEFWEKGRNFWAKRKDLTKSADIQGKTKLYKTLAFYLNDYIKTGVLSVYLCKGRFPPENYTFCDIVLDLRKGEFEYNN